MTRQGRILALDDEERWREVLSETLSSAGYYVDTAGTVAQALEKLNSTFYHLLLFDISMNREATNDEGMQLIDLLRQRGYNEAAGMIVLTGYSSSERMRMAFRDYKVIDFLTKQDFDDRVLVQLVKQFFKEKFGINLDLKVQWQQVASAKQVFHKKLFCGQRISNETPELAEQATQELDDLLCRLFPQAESVLVRPLTSGHSHTGVLWIQPFYANGAGRTTVVKFGDSHEIDKEYDNYLHYVQPYIGGGHSTTVLGHRHTARLGGIIYSFLGVAGDRADDFATFYQSATVEQCAEVLDRLFFDICASWYANRSKVQPFDLTEEYLSTLELSLPKLEQTISERLKGVQGKQRLTFRALGTERTFVNPLLALGEQHLWRSTYSCTTHGDLTALNIFIDSSQHAWLIDFMRTGTGHVLRDVALLDVVVRVMLLAEQEATLAERLLMEETLHSITEFGDLARLPERLPSDNPAISKAYSTSLHLREIAHRLVSSNRDSNLSEMYIASLYYALNFVRFYNLSHVQREHALLLASLITERLEL